MDEWAIERVDLRTMSTGDFSQWLDGWKAMQPEGWDVIVVCVDSIETFKSGRRKTQPRFAIGLGWRPE